MDELVRWIDHVRKKFALPTTAKASVYWQGYEGCLQDVERFIQRHGDLPVLSTSRCPHCGSEIGHSETCPLGGQGGPDA